MDRLYGFGFKRTATGTVRVVMHPKPDGSIELYEYNSKENILMCSGMDALPEYIKYALSAKVEYRFPTYGDKFGCVMHIPKAESEALFKTYRIK